jgi:hypothetical protein
MQLNPQLLEAARQMVSIAIAFPAEIPGFPGLYLSSANDRTINTIGGFVLNDVSYKIGTRDGEPR